MDRNQMSSESDEWRRRTTAAGHRLLLKDVAFLVNMIFEKEEVPMRWVKASERMPTEADGDSAGDVVWIAICTSCTRTGMQKRYYHSAHESCTDEGLGSFKDQVGFGVDLDGSPITDDEIFWLEVHPQPVQQEVKSHIRKVEL